MKTLFLDNKLLNTIAILFRSFLFLILLQITTALVADSKKHIYIYAGTGTSDESIVQTQNMLQRLIDINQYTIDMIQAETIIQADWAPTTALLILPGGADLPYVAALNGSGNAKILEYVEHGGAYLGICAGAYYSGAHVSFAVGTPFEVTGSRELQFFQGVVEGPVLAAYDYSSSAGCRAAKLTWELNEGFTKGTKFKVFYNGGGYFVITPENSETFKTLASYELNGSLKPAIIEVHIGAGRAILSGPHWEYEAALLDPTDVNLKTLIPVLLQADEQRLELAKYLLKRLGICTR